MARRSAMTVESLAALGADRLAALVLDETLRNPPFKKIAAAAIAGTKGPEAVAALIDRRLLALERARGFVDWQKRKAFAADLAATLSTVSGELGTLDPPAAIDRLLRLLGGAGAMFERVDDSSGAISDVYSDAADAVPKLAGRLSEDERVSLAGRLGALLAKDSHGLIATALAGCIPLLPPPRLGEVDAPLAAALKALGPPGEPGGDWERRLYRQRIMEARKALADRAGDVDAFIAVEVQRPAGVQDTLAIAERLLGAGRLPEALDWIRRPARRGVGYADLHDIADGGIIRDWSDTSKAALEIRILDAMGERDAAQALRWSVFDDRLAPDTLREIIAHEPDFGEFDALDRAFARAAAHPRRFGALSFFLSWPRLDLAAQLVLDHGAAWDGRHYEILVPAAEALEDHHPDAATVLYRALIDDVLARGRSQAYGHAARHLRALDRLASAPGDVASHAAYRAGLKSAHGRKYGFWSLVVDA